MKFSNLLIPTVKEVPAEAEIPSHRLMIRAGYFRKVASGTYTYLVLGLRSLRKIEQIIREEMDAAGAQEISMPFVQPVELWEQTGRLEDYGETLGQFTDRHGRANALAPTAEETVTSLVAQEVASYKQLPLNLYQIKLKYRDEFRPRFGALRSREFVMKDAYSFHASPAGPGGLDETYLKMAEAYRRIFQRCGLKFVVVQATSGEIGGSGSEEFMVPCEAGEDVIVHTADGGYAANIEKAQVDPPNVAQAESQDIVSAEDVHTPGVGTIEAVCEFLGAQPAEMIKTLIYQAGDATVAALIRGDHDANEAKLQATLDGLAVELAGEDVVQQLTGAGVGFAGPVGLAGKVDKFIIDQSVAAMQAGVGGANKTDYHTKNIVPGRDFPLEGDNVIVADIRNAVPGDTHNGQPLQFSRGIEVGHIFKLGTKYSEKLGATFLDETGQTKPCIMGCYGVGVNRILASAIEADHDEAGCVLPVNIAPFEVEVIPLARNKKAPEEEDIVAIRAGKIYDELQAGGVDVLLDDRAARPGVKFKDADLIGIPVRVVLGERGLRDGNVEIKKRTDKEATLVPVGQAVARVREILAELRT